MIFVAARSRSTRSDFTQPQRGRMGHGHLPAR